MSDARRLQMSLLVSFLVNAAALMVASWFWHFQPIPAAVPRPRIKLVRVALVRPAAIPKPVLSVVPVLPPVPSLHMVKPKPLPKHRRPGAHVKSSSPAPPTKAAGGSDAGAAAPPIAAAPPVPVIASNRPAPLIVHNLPVSLPPLPTPSISPGIISAPPQPKAVPTAQTGYGASGVDTLGKGKGAGEGAGIGTGLGSGSSRDAGEPFGVGKGLAGDGGPRHIVYVLDISRSMVSRIVRADAEIRKALAGLRPDETFDIIAFNNIVRPFDTELAPATPSVLHEASVFLDTLQVNDGTNTQAGMRAALSIPDVNEVVLLTDGRPSQGITDPDSLVEYIRHCNKNHARISCVGMVGTDESGVDRTFEATSLLQQIAHDSGGACEIVPLGYVSDE